MSETYLDDLFDQLVTVEPRPAWNDVLARTRRSRRRFGAMAVVIALFVLVPAAWAVDGGFEGSSPPPSIQSAAAWANTYLAQARAAVAAGKTGIAPPSSAAPVDLSKLHGLIQIQTPDGPVDAWGAPTTNGGLCWWIGFQADFANGKGVVGMCSNPGGLANNFGVQSVSWHPDVEIAAGYTDNADATSAQITLVDGRSATSPVADGFYMAVFSRDPAADSNVGISTIDTYDASGKEIESWQNP